MKPGAWVLVVTLAALATAARADDTVSSNRIVLDSVAHEPSSIGGTRLQIKLSALTLQGQRIELDPKSIKTYLGSTALDAPFAVGRFGDTHSPIAIVVVVQATLDYSDVLPTILETLDASVLGKLDDKTTEVAILAFGDSVGTGKLGSLKTARAHLARVTHDGSSTEPALLETIERALLLLKKAKTEPEGRLLRKVIVVIGDGRDRAGDRERVTRVGERAGREGVRVLAFAHSPPDQRRPLLLLGELARKSQGTFRWLQRGKADSWSAAFEQLREEILDQYVLTYFAAAEDEPAGKKLHIKTVGRVIAESNELKVPEATCAGQPCAGYCADRCMTPRVASGRGILGWIVMVGGIALGGLALLVLIGFALSKRGSRPAPTVVPVVPPPPGSLPPAVAVPVPVPVPMPAPAPASVPPAAVGRLVPHLMFVNGPRAGERLPLRHGFAIGKAPGCDLVIEDGYTSTHHAQIGIDHAGNCRLYDRGSTNGTFVNGVRITEAALEHGVTVRFGSTELRFLAQ